MKKRFALSAVCLSVMALTGPVARAADAQGSEDASHDRGAQREQRRAELRQAIASQRASSGADMPLRTLSDRERAELREQLRRESGLRADGGGLRGPGGGAGGPRR